MSPSPNPRTEVGHLGVAFNTMVDRIEESFAERDALEQRLRRFVADASHELRTPLTSIRGYAELFRRGAADDPDQLALAMRRIEDEASRMGVLVDDLLLLARLDQGRPLERSLSSWWPSWTTPWPMPAPSSPTGRSPSMPGRPVVVSGDDVRLHQVVANLLSNARVHTPRGHAGDRPGDVDGPNAVIEVADQGPGMTADDAAHVFERFYRADPSRNRKQGGAGLGLAIVAAVVSAHGGRVSVTATPGQGARLRGAPPHGTAATGLGSGGCGSAWSAPTASPCPAGCRPKCSASPGSLRRLGHEARVLAPCDGPPPELFVTPLGNSIPTAANGSMAPVAPDLAAALRTIRALRDEEFDVVHLHEPLAPRPDA